MKMIKVEFGFGIEEDKDGNGISPQKLRNDLLPSIESFAAQTFGNYTLYQTDGGWINPQGRLVQERGMTLMVLVSPDRVNLDRVINSMATTVRDSLKQVCVAVTQTEVDSVFV